MQQVDISNTYEFTRGVARFSRIAADIKSGVQAWRRSYLFEPWRDAVELFIPQGGKFYPEENLIKRRIPANDPRVKEKISFYLENGVEGFFPGDEKQSIFQ